MLLSRLPSKKGISTLAWIVLIMLLLGVILTISFLQIQKQKQQDEEGIPLFQNQQKENTDTGIAIAAYEEAYDNDEYCYDGEIYEMKCEDTCEKKLGGKQILPHAAFAHSKTPKKCCQYPPTTWPTIDNEPSMQSEEE